MLLQIGPLLRLGPNGITDGTFITLGSSYYTCAFYNFSFFIYSQKTVLKKLCILNTRRYIVSNLSNESPYNET